MPTNAGDMDLIPESGRSPGEGNGNPLQHSCQENPKERGAWQVQSMGSQRVKHDLVTEQHLQHLIIIPSSEGLIILR